MRVLCSQGDPSFLSTACTLRDQDAGLARDQGVSSRMEVLRPVTADAEGVAGTNCRENRSAIGILATPVWEITSRCFQTLNLGVIGYKAMN